MNFKFTLLIMIFACSLFANSEEAPGPKPPAFDVYVTGNPQWVSGETQLGIMLMGGGDAVENKDIQTPD